MKGATGYHRRKQQSPQEQLPGTSAPRTQMPVSLCVLRVLCGGSFEHACRIPRSVSPLLYSRPILTWHPRPRMSVDFASTSAGRNITVDCTASGTSCRPGGRSNSRSFTSLPGIETVFEFPATDIVTSPDFGPVESFNVSFEAPAGATHNFVSAVPRDQKTGPSGYACSSV